jgi:ADP-ribose pyrophosphatase
MVSGQDMNFEEIQREMTYHGRAFDVQRVKLRLPNQKETTYDLVEHRGAVVIVPLDSDGNIWFVEQYRLGAEQVLLELPAGTLENGEDPLVCAAREIREEIGMAAGQITLLGEIYIAPGYSSERQYLFLAEDLKSGPLKGDDDEFIEVCKYPAKTVFEMAEQGKIKDGKTLAALLMVQPRLNSALK